MLLEERGLLQAALESAAAAGVEQVVTIGLDLEDSDRNRRLADDHPGVFFTVGWHPHTPRAPDGAELRALGELLAHPRAVAVGEVGLDFFWRPGYHETPEDVQRAGLRAMLDLAAAAGKPVVVHDRDAHEATLSALAEAAAHRPDADAPWAVLHCFSGDVAVMRRAVSLGAACSFAGTITFPRSDEVREAAAAVPGDRHLVETDAPFLAPVPHRGRPNLPGYVAATAAALAGLRGEPEDTVRRRCADNARRVFGLPDRSRGDVVSRVA